MFSAEKRVFGPAGKLSQEVCTQNLSLFSADEEMSLVPQGFHLCLPCWPVGRDEGQWAESPGAPAPLSPGAPLLFGSYKVLSQHGRDVPPRAFPASDAWDNPRQLTAFF